MAEKLKAKIVFNIAKPTVHAHGAKDKTILGYPIPFDLHYFQFEI